MEEWKELELSEDKDEWTVVFGDNGVITIRYRKRQPEQPTHEEQCKKLAYKIKNGQRISDIVNAVLYLLEKDIKEPS